MGSFIAGPYFAMRAAYLFGSSMASCRASLTSPRPPTSCHPRGPGPSPDCTLPTPQQDAGSKPLLAPSRSSKPTCSGPAVSHMVSQCVQARRQRPALSESVHTYFCVCLDCPRGAEHIADTDRWLNAAIHSSWSSLNLLYKPEAKSAYLYATQYCTAGNGTVKCQAGGTCLWAGVGRPACA